MTQQDLADLARTHGLRVTDDGALWGHLRGLMSLARALMQAEAQACEHAVGHCQCAEIIRKRRQA